MKEFIEKLISRLEEEIVYDTFDHYKEEPLINMNFEKLEDIINQLAEEYNNGWIPCSERLPEYTDEYLVTIDGANSTTTLSYDEVLCEWFDDECNVYPVIAWQPLPAPYKEGD